MNQKIEMLLGSIFELTSSSPLGLRLEYRSSPTTNWDLRVVSNRDDVLGSVQTLLRDRASIETLQIKNGCLYVTFNDDYLTGQIDRFLDGLEPLSIRSPFRGKRAIVQFIDPNTTKALHLGHLYEAILGNSLAALLESLGVDVRRYCFVSDISRSVCEAMAGYEVFGKGGTPESYHEKPDQMVGRLYAQYAAQYYELHPDEADNEDPIRRETGVVGDLADNLMRGYQAGDEDTRGLWRKIRKWVLDGQFATLARLNVQIDTVQYGSETDPIIEHLIHRGLESGVLKREASGTILFYSGKQEYRAVVVTRPDGFPTEHTRQMAQMISVFAECKDLDRYYTFMGMEWKPAWVLYENILRGCGDSPYHDIVMPVCHGMVMVDGSKMKSSKGAVVLADHFLDQVEQARGVRSLAEESEGAVSARTLADIIVKAFFLSRRIGKDLNFSWDQVLSSADNPGWDIASAWCAMNPAQHAGSRKFEDFKAARTIFFRAFDLDRVLNHAASEIDMSVAVRFLQRFAQSYVRTDPDARLISLARRTMERGLVSLGMAH